MSLQAVLLIRLGTCVALLLNTTEDKPTRYMTELYHEPQTVVSRLIITRTELLKLEVAKVGYLFIYEGAMVIIISSLKAILYSCRWLKDDMAGLRLQLHCRGGGNWQGADTYCVIHTGLKKYPCVSVSGKKKESPSGRDCFLRRD